MKLGLYKPLLLLLFITMLVGLVGEVPPGGLGGSSSVHAGEGNLPNEVSAGEVVQDMVVLWARSDKKGKLKFEVSTSAKFKGKNIKVGVRVKDPLVPAKVELTGLSPGTRYYYRVKGPKKTISTGTFETLAAAGTHAGLRFGVLGDHRGDLAPFVSVRNAIPLNLDFFVDLGDTIYADIPSPDLTIPQATTLPEFRIKHQEVYAERLGLNVLGDLRAATSWRATIDDHEVTNDFAGGAPPSSDSRFSFTTEDFINETLLYLNGLQAFREYNPIRAEFYGDTSDPRTANKLKLYRSWQSGSDAAFMMLDARSFRDTELPSVADLADPAQIGAFLVGAFTPGRTMLGAVQLAELKADLLRAQNDGLTWKFVLVPEPIQNLGVFAAEDRFEGYAAERTHLLKFIDDNAVENVVFIAADIHGTIVNNLSYQTAPFGPQIPVDAFEITVSAVAYDAPLGPTVIDILTAQDLLSDAQRTFYDSLPLTGKDDFVESFINLQLGPLGYDPIGLEGSSISSTLLQGDYTAVHYYGWTEFEIDKDSQELTVTTYGIDPYTEADILGDPDAVLARAPTVVSKFVVAPK